MGLRPVPILAMLVHESGSQAITRMKQFNVPSTANHSRMPNWGFPDGWGIAQIDLSASGTSAPVPALWNWKFNVVMGFSVLRDKVAAHSRYMNALRREYGDQFCDPHVHPVAAPFGEHEATIEMSDIMKRYNGMPEIFVRLDGRNYSIACRFTPDAEACGPETILNKWEYVADDYVELALREHADLIGY